MLDVLDSNAHRYRVHERFVPLGISPDLREFDLLPVFRSTRQLREMSTSSRLIMTYPFTSLS